MGKVSLSRSWQGDSDGLTFCNPSSLVVQGGIDEGDVFSRLGVRDHMSPKALVNVTTDPKHWRIVHCLNRPHEMLIPHMPSLCKISKPIRGPMGNQDLNDRVGLDELRPMSLCCSF